MAIYVKFGDIKGSATEEKHKDWITVDTMTWGIKRAVSVRPGAAVTRETNTPQVNEVRLIKHMDKASQGLLKNALKADSKDVEIHVVQTGSGNTYAEYKLTHAMVTEYSVEVSEAQPVEVIALNFTKVEYKFIPFKDNNTPDSPLSLTYDLAKNVVS